jgi:hypothetical protein
MVEITGNLHLHTVASDGTGTHDEVASAAARAELDFIVYTDHNVWVEGEEGWYHDAATDRRVLCLMGQEVNDPKLEPERNHLLCHFVRSDLDHVAHEPQQLIDTVLSRDGLAFLAHPLERPGFGEAAHIYPWTVWDISGFTGIELWNAMTDVKWRLRNFWPRGLIGAFVPNWVLSAPFPEVLAKWDELLATGQRVVAIGGSDAHAMSFTWRGITRTVYPYDFLFQAVNTHLLLPAPLADELDQAKSQIYEALKAGHCFVGYDAIGSPSGFRFTATSGQNQALMGDILPLNGQVRVQVASPQPAYLRLIKDGRPVLEKQTATLEWVAAAPGVYRVEAYRRYWGELRGWVFTNPIYIIK